MALHLSRSMPVLDPYLRREFAMTLIYGFESHHLGISRPICLFSMCGTYEFQWLRVIARLLGVGKSLPVSLATIAAAMAPMRFYGNWPTTG
jgi:hypothetical protein